MKNHYTILEVPENASEEVIKKSYHKLANKWHPDKNNGDKKCEEKFKDILNSYEILSDKNKRAQFDIQRAQFRRAEQAARAQQSQKENNSQNSQSGKQYYQPSAPSGAGGWGLLFVLILIIAAIASDDSTPKFKK